MKRISSIRTLFWGLLIVFIDININNFDILNDILGYFIIISGLSKLVIYSGSFLKALSFAKISLAFHLFSIVLSFSELSTQQEIIFAFIIIGIILNLIMTYYIITGLSNLADDQDLTDLSKRLSRGFRFYLMALLLTVMSILIMPFAVFFLISAIIIYIYVLAQIYSAYKSIDGTSFKEPARKSGILTVLKIILFAILLGIGVIGISDTQIVKAQPFIKYDLTENQDQISSIRTKMVDLGIETDVVDSMPDSEIILYKNIKKVQSSKSEEIFCDGGKLELTQYVNSLDSKIYRYIAYYKWIKKPKLAHAEVFGIALSASDVVFPNDIVFSSLNLYDIKDKDGNIQVYTSKDIVYKDYPLTPQKKFKLTDSKNADNYRGYIAMNTTANGPMVYNNSFFYIHQSTIFNNRGMDIIDFNNELTVLQSHREDHFFKEYYNMAYVEID